MRQIIAASFLFFLTLSPIVAADLTPEAAANLETAIRTATPGIRSHLITVGRTSLPDLRPGVLLDADGHILCPRLAPIDGVAVPYLIYGEGGNRSATETVWEDEKAGLAIIRASGEVLAGKVPASLADDDSLSFSWFIAPGFPPVSLPGDVPQLHLAHLLSGESVDINVRLRSGGHPLFDLAGRLFAVTTRRLPGGNGFGSLRISELVERFPDLADRMPPIKKVEVPDLPYYLAQESEDDTGDGTEPPNDPARDALTTLASRATAGAPTVAIYNHAGVSTTGIHGLIIDADGLILTKASEIGPAPVVQIGEESYPAVLLATDDATDLALLSIEASGLPVVRWSDTEPGAGMLVHSPQIHTSAPFNFTTASGLLSHRLPAHPASSLSVHSPERITSLGIVPEHDLDVLKVAAILPDSPAATAKLLRGDILLAINDTPIPDRAALRGFLAEKEVGAPVLLRIERDGDEKAVSLDLASAHLRLPVTEPMIGESTANLIITPPSIRRSGFPETFVHDLVIEHWQNGSPLCDSRGGVIGINIATVTYDRTLALPVPAIKKAIARMRAKPNSF